MRRQKSSCNNLLYFSDGLVNIFDKLVLESSARPSKAWQPISVFLWDDDFPLEPSRPLADSPKPNRWLLAGGGRPTGEGARGMTTQPARRRGGQPLGHTAGIGVLSVWRERCVAPFPGRSGTLRGGQRQTPPCTVADSSSARKTCGRMAEAASQQANRSIWFHLPQSAHLALHIHFFCQNWRNWLMRLFKPHYVD